MQTFLWVILIIIFLCAFKILLSNNKRMKYLYQELSNMHFDNIIKELEEYYPEAQKATDDIKRFVNYIGPLKQYPEAEIDEDCIDLEWNVGPKSFSLIFSGDGKVTGCLSPYQSDYPPWKTYVSSIDIVRDKILDLPRIYNFDILY